MRIQSNLIDIRSRNIYFAEIQISDGKISSIQRLGNENPEQPYILPGFIDAHIHIESSMLPPVEFGRMAIVHGTVACVSDPHEIANVLGVEGVNYMIQNAKLTPLKIFFGAPSCVPATSFETAGATLNSKQIQTMLQSKDIHYLSEMMNFPGVIYKDAEVMKKLQYAKDIGKPIDGHAPGLRGADAVKYFGSGISTDHECFTYEEALEKLKLGVKILIREGSAAKNFEALWPLIDHFPNQIMLCSDDKHPDDLLKGHINLLVKRALQKGCDLFNVLQAACLNPIEHYNLSLGTLRKGESADFIRISNLQDIEVLDSWINGEQVLQKDKSKIEFQRSESPNRFDLQTINKEDIIVKTDQDEVLCKVIKAIDGEIVTGQLQMKITSKNQRITSNSSEDFLKIIVINRYSKNANLSIGFITGFGLQHGAIASSVAHDSHNIVCVGVEDESIIGAVQQLIESKGGICAVNGDQSISKQIPLAIAGLMSLQKGEELAKQYTELDQWVKAELGCTLTAPFMTLSFMALPVIPSLKITDKGLFDVDVFGFVELLE